MLLISRIVTLGGGARAAMEAATRIHAAANDAMDIEVSLAAGGPGYPGGSFVYSAVVENMVQAQAEEAKLVSSSDYLDASEKAASLALAPVESRMRAFVSMAPADPVEIALGSTISIFTAQMRSGAMAEAMAFGTEMVDYVHHGTGLPVAMLRSVSGNVGELAWIGVMPTAADVDKEMEWEATDSGYHERYASAAAHFAEGSAHRGFITRIA